MSQIYTIAQQKGGSGKTTLATHLAIAFHKMKDMRVGLLDVDPQGSLGEWFEARERALGDDIAGELTFRTASGWGARREARSMARDHDIVVVDTPPKSDSEARPAIEAAQRVIIPVQPSPVDVWATQSILDIAAREKTETLLILNRVPPRASLTGEMSDALSGLGVPVAQTRLGNRVVFAAAMGKGLTALETEPSGKAANEARALASEILAL